MTRKTLNQLMRKASRRIVDEALAASGFAADRTGLLYQRRRDDAVQSIVLHYEFKPEHTPTCLAFVYPYAKSYFPKIHHLVGQMGLDRSRGSSDVTFYSPLELIIPPESRKQWLVYSEDTIDSCVASIAQDIKAWIVPFMGEYTTIASLTSAYERNDRRLLLTRESLFNVVAAYLLLCQPQKAMGVLDERFGQAGPRRTYSSAFTYVSSRLTET
jgi:hypothetical protein